WLVDLSSDDGWALSCLAMRARIGGRARAAFAWIRDSSKRSLAAAVNGYVMQDEARHVVFGRLTLRDYYPQLTQAERDEREEFVVYASYLMRDRFRGDEVWEHLGLPVDECISYVEQSQML